MTRRSITAVENEDVEMMKFEVGGMTCGGCAAAVRRAVQCIDATATVEVDLAGRLVSVNSTAGSIAITAAIVDAGFDAQPIAG